MTELLNGGEVYPVGSDLRPLDCKALIGCGLEGDWEG